MSVAKTVWFVGDDQMVHKVLKRAMRKTGINARFFFKANMVLRALSYECPKALITDIGLSVTDSFEFLKHLQSQYPQLPVIMMAACSDLDSAVSAFNSGAFEYLPKPLDVNEVLDTVRRACNRHQDLPSDVSRVDLKKPDVLTEMMGEAPAMQEVFRVIGRLARSHLTVLINGESGTGKELVAKALHRHSPRAQQPFIALNMAAIPRDLMESELFGHEKGAFTGAQGRRMGRFEQANNGTLFLDEIGDMPAELQTRLLRVLADNEFYPLGGHHLIKVDVRNIAATHQNLEQLVAEGRFREDLFHRLNVIRIQIPPLRDRQEDIGLLMRHFLQLSAQELGSDVKVLRPEVETLMRRFNWPGNVRQLENICRRLTVMSTGREIYIEDLPSEITHATYLTEDSDPGSWQPLFALWVRRQLNEGRSGVARQAVQVVEGISIQMALQHTQGSKHEAAQLLGYGRNTLSRKIKESTCASDKMLPNDF